MSSTARHLPRSNYADRLAEFGEFVFAEAEAFARTGCWRLFFAGRMGSGFDRRVIVELGCADGTLLTSVAARYPHTAFVGLDWKCKPLHDCAARVASEKLNNVALLRARGQDLGRAFGQGEVAEVWLFHPDPCDTAVELKNRLMSAALLADVHRVMRPAGIVAMKTDHAAYDQWTLELLGSQMGRRLFDVSMMSNDFWTDQAALAHTRDRAFAGLTTPFESRFIKKRQPIYYVEMRRK